MASSASPASPGADFDNDDKPRVLVDGPGGADTKQGAKIACLECRSAKIKCSAPTDGQVPCKRCVKHQRECLFEKHKRGRKPNKRFSVPSDLRSARNGDGQSYDSPNRPTSSGGRSDTQHSQSHHKQPPQSQHQSANKNGRGTPDKVQSKHDPGFASGDGQSGRPSFNEKAWNSGGGDFGQSAQQRGGSASHYSNDRFHGINAGLSSSMSAPSGLAHAGMPYSYAPQSNLHHPPAVHSQSGQHHQQSHQHHHYSQQHSQQPQHHQQPQQPQHHQQQQSASSYAHSRHSNDHPSPGRWRDHASQAAVSSPHTSHSASSASVKQQHDPYLHSRSRPYPHNAPAPSHNYAHWDSQLGSERSHKSRLDLSPSRRPDAPANPGQSQQKPYGSNNERSSSQTLSSSSKGRTQRRDGPSSHHHRSSSRSNAYDPDADEEYEDEQDELEDDADATREEHDYVLSNPLKLLAQASDAAAARIEGGRVEPGSRSSLAAVETMGLLHPTLPSNRMAVSAAVNLTGLGRPLYGRKDDDPSRNRWPANRVLPPLLHANRSGLSTDEAANDASHRSQPPFLKDSMRSKSFPEGELPRIDGPVAMDESDPSVPAAGPSVASQLSASKTVSAASLGRSNVLTPSTLDHDAWEYREGKAQARRGYGSGASPGGLSGDAGTTSSSVSGAAANGQKPGGVSAINGASPGEIIESPADEVTTAMLGKRKRGRSRAARGGGLPSRRRRLAEWDTDAENGDGLDDETAPESVKAKQVTISTVSKPKEASGVTSGGEGEAGASRKGYFNLSLFHSKNDDTEGLDPVELGLVELRELERLFDIFFARINPVLDLFDPFLHSVAFVRMRSAFLTTVISSMAARFSDTPQDARLAAVLDKHWQEKLLPMILLGGYKSVEISQAFLILTTYSRPTNRLVDDRSWQYLGFAIRTATEVGVNRKVTPSENLLGNEQVARRVRNRERLWYNLFLYDRTLSAQTGRPWTISEDRMIVQSSMWHRQDFALPEDVSLVSLIKLRRITAQHTEAFDAYLTSPDRFDETQTATALGVGGQSMFERRLSGLEFFRKNANADLEKWKETWCINTDDKIKEVDTSTAAGKYLIRWAPTAKLFYYHSRLLINSLVLGATEQYEGFLSGSAVSVDCWTSAISLIDTVLNDFTEEALVTWSNDRVVMAVYAAVSAVRMTNLQHKYAFADKETLLALVRRLATSMTNAGKTPRHRNGSATPYGRYLRSVLAAFEPETPAVAAAGALGAVAAAAAQTPGKDSEQATSITTSSLAPGDSRSAGASPPATAAHAVSRTAETGEAKPPAASGTLGGENGDSKLASDSGKAGDSKHEDAAAGDKVVPSQGVLGSNEALGGGVGAAPAVTAGVSETATGKAVAALPLIVTGDAGVNGELDMAAPLANAAVDAQSMEKLLGGLPMDASTATTPLLAEPMASVAWPSTSNAAVTSGGAGPELLTGAGMLLSTPIAAGAVSQAGGVSSDAMAAAAAAAASIPNVVDDPESLERMWNYMTAFDNSSFWQPQSSWNLSGAAGNTGQHHNH
ncbi:uncharacterized protein PAN0_007d3326 [Moesziomyces antarcticus]|uniref:Uncharacterized protein n=2 Tax=Pseudozyma antarctica TaxID=84753 RepID=A0A081CEL3_PSEA2|nr:uncharacterized protein PAN0_007d3326 [Moesziomyces antarcticus]GAK65109.1 conserved hypothetical protein [Moesziomyces antarcticus]SPO45900.1 uncharacterized protein PSANT_03586 [Moesziomyces antarcticus]